MNPKSHVILHKGQAFASQGLGKFAKDIVRVGEWIHPVTGQEVKFDRARLQKLAANTARYLENGNKIPFPDGHSFDAMKNLGDWPGPFIVHEDALVGVVQPKAAGVAEKLSDGSIDAVSAYIDVDVTDPKGNSYDEVITHVCATPYPVITGQKEFQKLSREMPTGLQLCVSRDVLDTGKAKSQDAAAMQAAVDAVALALEKGNALQTNAKRASVQDVVLEALAESLAAQQGDTFPGGFDGCMKVQMGKGLSKESAQKLCAYIGRRAGKIP